MIDSGGCYMVRRTAVGVLACALLLAGCAEKHEASQTLPPAAGSTSASPTLTPLGPADLPMPEEARTRDPAGMVAFTRYYLALINRTSTVMDAKPLRDLSEACETCDRIASDTEKDAAAGYHYQGGEISVTSSAPANVSGDRSAFAFLAKQAQMVVVDETGKVVPGLTFKALSKISSGSTARWDAHRRTWLMTQLTLG